MGGMPPAFIFAEGCLKSSASWSGENFAFMPSSAGAAAVPTPASPWHALQDCASKMLFPFAASGSASVTFAAATKLFRIAHIAWLGEAGATSDALPLPTALDRLTFPRAYQSSQTRFSQTQASHTWA